MPQVSSYTSWQPLEEVIVGKAYTPDYFDFIDNTQVRDQLQQILFETNEDLDNLQKHAKHLVQLLNVQLFQIKKSLWHGKQTVTVFLCLHLRLETGK